MISVGYMAKRVTLRPEWMQIEGVVDVYSVSGCVSKDFANYIDYWGHNGYWLFDSPGAIRKLAQQNSIDLKGTTLFFYQVHELQFDNTHGQWTTFKPERSFPTKVVVPSKMALEGYDVVTFSAGAAPECSPLSCNSLAAKVTTNPHCLLASLAEAQNMLQSGQFENTEPGPYRIFAVYSVGW